MKKKLLSILLFFLTILIFPEENQYGQLDPINNIYSLDVENNLFERGYIKIAEDEFDRIGLFKEIYKIIYLEDYNQLVPDYCIVNFFKDGLYYEMLNCILYENNPPLMTYVILKKDNHKFYYYKFNYNLDFELYKSKTKIAYESNLKIEEKEIKIFY